MKKILEHKPIRKAGYELNGKPLKPETLMLSYGYKPSLSEGSLKCPIFQTSTFVFETAEEGKDFFSIAYGLKENNKKELGLIYSRINNPDLEILEDRLAVWDNADMSAVFPSGMAAITTMMLEFLRPGDSLLFTQPLYGGSHHFIEKVLVQYGVKGYGIKGGSTYQEIKSLIEKENIKNTLAMIYLETPANPTNELVDIEAFVKVAKEFSTPIKKVITAVDNTFLGPVFQHPMKHGADLVLYSATKFIGGHSDLIAGVCSGELNLMKRVKTLRTFLGSVPDAWTSWLMLRSLETLKIRMKTQNENAKKIAQFLNSHPKVEKVYYPGLLKEGSAQYDIFKRHCEEPGSMISFDVKGGEAEAFKFLNTLKIFHLAVSLGGTESLAEHPYSMTHADVPSEEKKMFHLTDKMVRLSVGIEDVDDLIADLSQSLDEHTNFCI
jgi:methionine-gamma-lyase